MSSKDITELLLEHENKPGSDALNKVFNIVYDEVRQLAIAHTNREYDDITLQPTELVHELFIKLVRQSELSVGGRKQFYAIASRCMRQILVDYARKKKADKRNGANRDLTLNTQLVSDDSDSNHLIEMDNVLNDLAKFDERCALIVEMKFFGGLNVDSISEVLEVSERTVKRDWKKAKLWIYKELKNE